MTDKELRRLSRLDLIDIIFELQVQNESMKKELSERALALEEAGSIAEASLKLNKVFETAQTAADQYLEAIKAANADAVEKLRNTDEMCRKMIAMTEEDCAARVAEADLEIEKKLEQFRQKVKKILIANPEIRSKLKADKAPESGHE